jgi:transcriptional regulator with XRE-family HTH domain
MDRNAYAKRLMAEIGLGQSDLARLTRKSRTLINEIANSKANAMPSFVKALEDLRGKPTDDPFVQQMSNELASVPEPKRAIIKQQLLDYVRLLKRLRE